jgi:hypothetical protein
MRSDTITLAQDEHLTLARAIKEFEAKFERVVEFDPEQPRAAIAPNGEPYVKIICGGVVPEGETAPGSHQSSEFAAAAAWYEWALRAAHAGRPQGEGILAKVLYWRTRPELARSGPANHDCPSCTCLVRDAKGRIFTVYSRMAFGD